MRESLLNLLMYVFENYLGKSTRFTSDEKVIADNLSQAGFNPYDIHAALGWFIDLNNITLKSDKTIFKTTASRILAEEEKNKMAPEAVSYLFHLEKSNIVDAFSRELILDRLMALEEPVINVPILKWVVLMVLFSQPEKHHQLHLMEDLVLKPSNKPLLH